MITLIKNFADIKKIVIKSFKYSNCTFSCLTDLEPHHPAL